MFQVAGFQLATAWIVTFAAYQIASLYHRDTIKRIVWKMWMFPKKVWAIGKTHKEVKIFDGTGVAKEATPVLLFPAAVPVSTKWNTYFFYLGKVNCNRVSFLPLFSRLWITKLFN